MSKNFIVSNLKKSETSYFIIRREVIPFLEKNKIFEDENKKKDIFGKFTKMTAATTFMDVNIDRIDELKSHWDEILIRKNSDKFAGMQLRNANRIMKSKQNILGSVAYKKEALTSRQREKIEGKTATVYARSRFNNTLFTRFGSHRSGGARERD